MKNLVRNLLTLVAIFVALQIQCQPGSTRMEDLLQFVDSHAMQSSAYTTAPGENSLVTSDAGIIIGQLDSFYYYRVENGKRSYWTEKTIIINDTIFHRFSDLHELGFQILVYSAKTGKLLKVQDQAGRTGTAYHFKMDGRLDSITSGSGTTLRVEYDDNREYWRAGDGQLLTYQEFDAAGHITQLCNFRGLATDGSEWRQLNYFWEKGQFIKSQTYRVKNGVSKPRSENIFERDKNGLLRSVQVFEFNSRDQKFQVNGFGGSVKYKSAKNSEGQYVITRTYEGSPVTYTFDHRGNWVSIVGKVVEEHRVLFYVDK
ncbi:MAG: hypothetical protein IPL65_17390 [Lewinellaceae bacterium]|nr:hypothetical protein [Lewinellaceae bacterium]